MRIKNSILVSVLSLLIIYIACRKADRQVEGSSPAEQTDHFFSRHLPSDPVRLAALQFVKSQNDRYHFVPGLVRKIGYPYWDKAIVVANLPPPANRTASDSADVVFVPFVQEQANGVDAALRISMNAGDTTFKIITKWQYSDSAGTGMGARDQSLLLMSLDKTVFGHALFKITDSTAFPADTGRAAAFVKLNGGISTGRGQPAGTDLVVTHLLQVCYEYLAPTYGYVTGCAPGDPCNPYHTVSVCSFLVWYEVLEDPDDPGSGPGSGGNSGNGGNDGNNGGPSGSGGSGGGWNPPGCTGSACGGGYILVEDGEDDPCPPAQNAAKRMDTVYAKSNVDSMLATVPNIETSTVEMGFPIFKRYHVPPDGAPDTTLTGKYKCGNLEIGGPAGIQWSFSVPYLYFLSASVHTHPVIGYNAQSANDIYQLIKERMLSRWYDGAFVVAYNGAQYAVTVTDSAKAAAFYNTKQQYLDSADWNVSSDIGRAFKAAYDYYEKQYSNAQNKIDIAYEMAMSAVLLQFNTGVMLSKKDATGHFKPIIVKTERDPRKPKRIVYTQLCP